MNRRSFLKILGLAPAVAAVLPAVTAGEDKIEGMNGDAVWVRSETTNEDGTHDVITQRVWITHEDIKRENGRLYRHYKGVNAGP